MFMIDYKDFNWWYWLALACVLTIGISGYPAGFMLTIIISSVHLIHFMFSEKSITSFPVQVRFWYLAYAVVSYPEDLQVLYWLPVVGTWARAVFGYCFLARTLSLLPWNRREPFSSALVIRAYFTRPVRGSILQGLSPLGNTSFA